MRNILILLLLITATLFTIGVKPIDKPINSISPTISFEIYNGGFDRFEIQFCNDLLQSNWTTIYSSKFKTRGYYDVDIKLKEDVLTSTNGFFRVLGLSFDSDPLEDTVITDMQFYNF